MKYIMLLLLPLTVFALVPKFHYRQCVIATSYFFSGCQGFIDSTKDCGRNTCYEVELTCHGHNKYVLLDEEELKACK